MLNNVFQKPYLLLILFIGILVFSCKKEEPVEPVTDAPIPSFGYTYSMTSLNHVAGYQVVLTNNTTDTAGVTFTWGIPSGATQVIANTFFVPQTAQITVSLSAARTVNGKVATRTTDQTIALTVPAPPLPTFTLADGGYRTGFGVPIYYIIELQNTTGDTTEVEFTCSLGQPVPDQPDKANIAVTDSGLHTVTLTAKRGGLEQTATQQVYIKGYTPPAPTPGFDITKGIFYQIPTKRPDGTDWNAAGTPPNQVLMMTDYHVTIGFMDAGNLPATHVFARTHNIPNSPALMDPHPDQYHEILYQYSLPGEAPVNYPTGIGFVPNDHRFAGTDSGYVELQNGLTHLKLWLKFTD